MTAASFNPFGPIFTKELRVTSRRKRTYLVRTLYLAGLLLFLLMAYQQSRAMYGYQNANIGAVARNEALQQLGANFFLFLSMFTWLTMLLIGPVLTATSVGGERLGKTLPVLLSTPLNSWQIVSGKLFSRVLGAFTLILLSLPVVAVVRLLGGVEVVDMFAALATCAATAYFGAAVGLLISTYVNRPTSVILLSYGLLLGLFGLVPMIWALLLTQSYHWAKVYGPAAAQLHPYYLLVMKLAPIGMRGSTSWWPTLVAQTILGTLLLGWSGITLRRSSRKLEDRGNPADIAPKAPGAPSDPASAAGADVYANPVLWREVRRPLIAKRSHLIITILAIIGLTGFVYYQMYSNNDFRKAEAQGAFVVIFNLVAVLMSCILSATVIAQERESDTWTLLMATPITAAQVIWGKTLGCLRKMAWPMAIAITHLLIFALIGVIPLLAVAVVVWSLIAFNLPLVAIGIYLSLRCRKTTTAVMINLAIPIVLFMILPATLSAFITHNDFPESPYLLCGFPYSTTAVTEFARHGWGATCYLPTMHQTSVGMVLWMCFFTGSVMVAIAATILWFTQSRFDRIVGRAPGK